MSVCEDWEVAWGTAWYPKRVFILPAPPSQNGTYFLIAVVLLGCNNLAFNRLVKLYTKRQSEAQDKEVWSDPCPSVTAAEREICKISEKCTEISQIYSEDLYV